MFETKAVEVKVRIHLAVSREGAVSMQVIKRRSSEEVEVAIFGDEYKFIGSLPDEWDVFLRQFER